MGVHLEAIVLRGEIDNRRRGRVTGTLWLAGGEQPMRLDLEGDACPDLAGCQLKFRCETRPPHGKPREEVALVQQGTAGEITASLRLQEPACTQEEMNRLAAEGTEVPLRQVNALYLEWFNAQGQRVIVETTSFTAEVSEPMWVATPESEAARAEASRTAFIAYFDRREMPAAEEDPADETSDTTPMNEFQWEHMLKESDRKSEQFGEVLRKYEGHPDSERLMAREMGWSWVEDELDAEERGLFEEEDDDEDLDGDGADFEPDPATEGIHWMRDEDGDIQHPLAHRAFRLGVRMWRYADEFDLLGENRLRAVLDMVTSAQLCSAKLAGALNSLAYDVHPEHGLIVASLKRALGHLNLALQAASETRQAGLIEAGVLDQWQAQLFELREGILALMEEHRRQMPS